MSDILEIFGTEYTGVTGVKATDSNNNTLTYIRPQGTKSITTNGTGIDVASYATVNVSIANNEITITDVANATGTTCVISTGTTSEEVWETLYNGNPAVNSDSPYGFFWLSSMGNAEITLGSEWRITIDNIVYRCTAIAGTWTTDTQYSGIVIGNTKYFDNATDNNVNVPFCFYNAAGEAWIGPTELTIGITHALKIEELVLL